MIDAWVGELCDGESEKRRKGPCYTLHCDGCEATSRARCESGKTVCLRHLVLAFTIPPRIAASIASRLA